MAQLLLGEDEIKHIILAHVERTYGRKINSLCFGANPSCSEPVKVRSCCITFQAGGYSNSKLEPDDLPPF